MRKRDDLPFFVGTDFEHENKTRDIPELKIPKLKSFKVKINFKYYYYYYYYYYY